MTIHPNMTIGEVVSHHYRTAEVFNKYEIDFCCGGKKTLARACEEKELDWGLLSQALAQALEAPELPSQNFDKWEPDFLVDYIQHTHHRYLRENLPLVCQYMAKTMEVHHQNHPELKIILKQLELLSTELLEHLDKEEQVLFPYIKGLCTRLKNGHSVPAVPFTSAEQPITTMEHEHDYAGSLLDNLREFTQNFTPPADACTTYKLAFAKLKELDADLRWHVHLENNVLFPKTLLLEQLINQKN